MPPVCCAKTDGPISDCVLQGVRHLFTVDGQLISSLDQLVDGRSYVCSSTLAFRRLDYEAIQGPTWIKQFKVCSLPHVDQTVQGVLFVPPGSNSSRTALCRTWIKQFKLCCLPHHQRPGLRNRRTYNGNSLPDNVISTQSLSTLRQRLKIFLFQASFPDIITDPPLNYSPSPVDPEVMLLLGPL